jgi:hypothetical protein
MMWAELVARMGEERNVYKVLVGKPEGKIPLGRPRRRWENGIRLDIKEIGWGSVEWIHFAQDDDRWRTLVNTVMNLRILEPRNYIYVKFSKKMYEPIQFTRIFLKKQSSQM